MSDNEKSSEPLLGAAGLPAPAPTDAPVKAEVPPAENTGVVAAAQASATPGFGSFGANRGSGLARGKRPATPAPSATPAGGAGYKPTSIEVLAPQTEYKNPFTGETTVSAPRANEPAPQAAPIAPVAPVVTADPVSVPTATETPAPVAAATPAPTTPSESDQKIELKILPPEETKRTSVRWEAPAGEAPAGEQPSHREERPTFRTERERREGRDPRDNRVARENQPRDPRDSRDPRENRESRDPRDNRAPRENREPRRDDRRFEPRGNQPQGERRPQPQPQPQVQPVAEKKSGGFVGWLKGLFGGGDKPAESRPTDSTGQEPRRDGEFRHRHRGGRGRGQGGGGFQGESRGPRPEGQQAGGYNQDQGGEPRGEGDFGPRRRRRRRGGRGRFNEGSDNGGNGGGGESRDPRPEGQQGGGAI